MSDLKSKQLAAQLLRGTHAGPLETKKVTLPGPWHLWLGVIYPAAVIIFELATRWCAQAFFDPMPTLWHVAAVSSVPAANLVLWLCLNGHVASRPRLLAFAGGLSIGIGAFYALIFLPLMPIAVIAVVFYGIGLLPLGPLASLISACYLTSGLKRKNTGQTLTRLIAGGVVTGLAVLVALDVPASATRVGVLMAASDNAAERQRGLLLLSALGDDDLLLRLCYDTTGRPSGPLSAIVMLGGASPFLENPDRQFTTTAQVREIFYRVHGEPFNARPAPFATGSWARLGDFQWDNDHGGTQVGGRIKGLDLVSSRIDGSINAGDAVAYLEWILEFRNTSPLDREARTALALPPGAVVSRATLWVNGEEREAAYGGRGAVRAAYERIAVQQRRDPLLVTTKGADRVLAQAFPVPRNGGTIKFKIGITAPLDLDTSGNAKLTMPAIVERNFSFPNGTAHTVWLASRSPMTSTHLLTSSAAGKDSYRLEGALTDAVLSRTRPTITLKRDTTAAATLSRLGQGAEIEQQIASRPHDAPSALYIVIDGSARARSTALQLRDALDRIPSGLPVGVMIASDVPVSIGLTPWSETHRQKATALIANTRFTGGQDNAPALIYALKALEAHQSAALLWVHGPQPIEFSATSGALQQASTRLARTPQLWLYATEPGPNALLPDLPIGWKARTIAPLDSDKAGLTTFMSRELVPAPRFKIERRQRIPRLASEPVSTLPEASDHVARLWARDKVVELATKTGEHARKQAIALATEYRLVTPVSGAVVLETHQQFADNGLTPATQSSVPTVPEPHEWALILMAAAAFFWLAWRQRREGCFA